MKLINSAAIDADAARNVIYSNRFKNDIESLNVSVSAAVAMHQLFIKK